MSDFINQLPPSFREALEQQQMPEMSEDIRAKMQRLLGLGIPEEEFTKAKRAKDD